MKKKEKPDWDTMDKKGFVMTNFVMANNRIMRKIMNKADMQTAMLYLIILSHRNTTTNECFPSISTLANECGVSTSTIKTMLTKLYDLKVLIINSGSQGVANNYYFPSEKFYKEFEDDFEQKLSKQNGRRKNPIK